MTTKERPDQERILLIDDEAIMHDVLGTLLRKEGYILDGAVNGREGLEKFSANAYDLVLVDLMMPELDGMEVLHEIRLLDPQAVLIMITAYGTIESAVTATRNGAYGFITKPFKNDELLLEIKNGLQKRALVLENLYLRQSFQRQYSFESIVGKAPRMQEIFKLIRQVAPTKSTVLVVGESGTGKELVAKAIHNYSPRSDQPFIPINCGNIPTELLESELFGFKKGAFTGAVATKKGLFEVANGGTIFLDEIGNISMELQAKLLRVIQEKEFRRLGDVENIRVDVRLLAASNEDVKNLVQQGKFREDLYYRLNVIRVDLPPLRERRDDIPLLVEHFIEKICDDNGRPHCTIEQDAMNLLTSYRWPGNVRELENVIERAIVLSGDDHCIHRAQFPMEMTAGQDLFRVVEDVPDTGLALKEAVADFERRLIVQALRKTSGNQKRAAQLLQLNATTLNEKLKRLDIDPSRI
ncbi:MAG TPA: sigma-54 dependent transcriptional regulator [Acidobacteriota bacterium]|nr:sigma-54-dependent Fis family transcriptional regulator [Acidobacteriota bacterium]HNR39073.1 sigma-54 dependent transcriptional regulator [Acidobacteriota bacterium]HNU01416.1 sigma-54 dependent transcriptional regulator [Acidobacteriota bacterium]HPB27845.1 sigma-54 dependent transcriptional regulator [Acidobacteriota bacterium]HQO25283.1 sigma-54 dependent transcriptional regulator [Acidobacteriota bacterium]